ncbi:MULTISPECIES: hypothetical protein [unclassified Brevundimonas]|jgi:hypothetical protein|uniref:hypothetical protein n=1 Tax=unclassified Brevundimonas TaxID=2622653 RepID=UPI000C654C6A|nr:MULTISPECIES: hypothetical protein [unclassified Brevundimonas]MAL89455.1 hypothetical protein [Brevundimonas sp.]HAV50876.1 hypothetical protein [Brevundimonas sp.]|tara:strand:+ start:5359 stop:5868 length:510 start_codon:yes stop_codon:yes gene_type:complete
MFAALVLSAWAALAAPEPGDAAAQLVRDACISTGMQTEAFERLGRDRRWRRAPLATPLSEQLASYAGFLTRDALVTLSTTLSSPGEPVVHNIACTVMSNGVDGDWLPEVEVLAAEMELDRVDVLSALPVTEEVHVWSDGPGEQFLTVNYVPERRVLSITYVKRVPSPAA